MLLHAVGYLLRLHKITNILIIIYIYIMCYTPNTTRQTFGYGPGRNLSETRHTVLGLHTETGQPTPLGLGSGKPTLQHQETRGPSTGADRESASAATEKDNIGDRQKHRQSKGQRERKELGV